jgi:hypothetical protein
MIRCGVKALVKGLRQQEMETFIGARFVFRLRTERPPSSGSTK